MNVEIGKRYNNWKVIAEAGPELGRHKYICECVCGTQRPVMKYNLGVVKGCGCDRAPYSKSGKYIGQKKSKPKNITINPRKLQERNHAKTQPHHYIAIKPSDNVKRNVSEIQQAKSDARRKAEDLLNEIRMNRGFEL